MTGALGTEILLPVSGTAPEQPVQFEGSVKSVLTAPVHSQQAPEVPSLRRCSTHRAYSFGFDPEERSTTELCDLLVSVVECELSKKRQAAVPKGDSDLIHEKLVE